MLARITLATSPFDEETARFASPPFRVMVLASRLATHAERKGVPCLSVDTVLVVDMLAAWEEKFNAILKREITNGTQSHSMIRNGSCNLETSVCIHCILYEWCVQCHRGGSR